jgi:hypothetical protein
MRRTLKICLFYLPWSFGARQTVEQPADLGQRGGARLLELLAVLGRDGAAGPPHHREREARLGRLAHLWGRESRVLSVNLV